MGRSSYLQLVPTSGRDLEIREGGEELQPRRESEVALRRWGRPFKPLPYQLEVIEGVRQSLGGAEGPFVGLISLPTGAGKTLTTSQLLAEMLYGPVRPVSVGLWIAPQKELLYQAFDAVRTVWANGSGPTALDLRVVSVAADLPKTTAVSTVLFCTPHFATLAMRDGIAPSIVVFDEAHHVAAPTFLDAWSLARRSPRLVLALGLSATPIRLDDGEFVRLVEAFDHSLLLPRSLYPNPVGTLIEMGVLARPTFCSIEGVPSFARADGLGAKRSIESLTSDAERWNATVQYVATSQKQTAVFAPSRDYGSAFTRHLRHLGTHAEYIDGQDSPAERLAVFTRFDTKRTRILVSVNLFVEGVDCPAAEHAVLTYPVRSQIRLSQLIGRVLRGPAVGGKDEAIVSAVEGSQDQLDDSLELRPYQVSAWRDLRLLP